MENTIHTIEVITQELPGLPDARGNQIKNMLFTDHKIYVDKVRMSLGYIIKANLNHKQINSSIYDLFADPIIEHGSLDSKLLNSENIFPIPPDLVIQVGFKPGVTDNAGHAALDGLSTLFPLIESKSEVFTSKTYMFWGVPTDIKPKEIVMKLYNPMIERAAVTNKLECINKKWINLEPPLMPPNLFSKPATIDLEVNDDKLIQISEKGLLALNLVEMKAIQSHYRKLDIQKARQNLGLSPNAPTDVELECLAQTWSEHCSHKIFSASIHHVDVETNEDTNIDSLFKTHIVTPTLDIQKESPYSFCLTEEGRLLYLLRRHSASIALNTPRKYVLYPEQ